MKENSRNSKKNVSLPPEWLALATAIIYAIILFLMLLQIKNNYQWRLFIPKLNFFVCILSCAFIFGQKIISKIISNFKLETTVISYINDSLILIAGGILPIAALTLLIFH